MLSASNFSFNFLYSSSTSGRWAFSSVIGRRAWSSTHGRLCELVSEPTGCTSHRLLGEGDLGRAPRLLSGSSLLGFFGSDYASSLLTLPCDLAGWGPLLEAQSRSAHSSEGPYTILGLWFAQAAALESLCSWFILTLENAENKVLVGTGCSTPRRGGEIPVLLPSSYIVRFVACSWARSFAWPFNCLSSVISFCCSELAPFPSPS